MAEDSKLNYIDIFISNDDGSLSNKSNTFHYFNDIFINGKYILGEIVPIIMDGMYLDRYIITNKNKNDDNDGNNKVLVAIIIIGVIVLIILAIILVIYILKKYKSGKVNSDQVNKSFKENKDVLIDG